MVKVYYTNVNEINGDGWEKITSQLPEHRRIKAEQKGREEDKKLSLATGYLLYFALRAEGVTDPVFEYGECGKPYLKGGEIYFNLSHSGNVAVCAVARSEVGIDVQVVKPVSAKTVSGACSKKEAAFCGGDAEKFCLLWSVKESVMKYFGKGLSLSPKRIEAAFGNGISVAVDGKDVGLAFAQYSCENHCVVVSARGESFPSAMLKVTP